MQFDNGYRIKSAQIQVFKISWYLSEVLKCFGNVDEVKKAAGWGAIINVYIL